MPKHVLAINGGSSSLKAAVFELAAPPRRVASVKVERIGSAEAGLSASFEGQEPRHQKIQAPTNEAALQAVVNCFGKLMEPGSLAGAGHRLVHGGPKYFTPQSITAALLEDLRKLEPFDPEHLPAQVGFIEALMRLLPGIPQVACFDTAFHHDLPTTARRLPIPRRFDAIGVRRYGFHGLSFSYLMQELGRLDPQAARGRVVLAHLGNGASLAAVRDGRSFDTSMSFTPAAGIPMGTRSGDLDPGLIDYLARVGGVTLEDFNRIVHLESGLLGISETTSDMQKLLELELTDVRAAEAVEIFCYQVRKWIGAYAAALGGLDTLVFAGGIGERASEIRRRICGELRFLGIELDSKLNLENAGLISSGSLPVKVRVIFTDEGLMIAQDSMKVLSKPLQA
jgi:acetate kinase